MVYKEDRQIALTPKEYDLLLFFINNQERVFSRDQLLEQVWGFDYAGESRTVDMHIRNLRKKLGLEDDLITLYRVGYKLSRGVSV